MNTLIDTHCHITCDALYERIDEVLENARQAGIEKMLIICTDFTEYERAQQLKEREPERFDIALGFHPNDLYAFQEADYERLEELLKQERLIAVGEIGLDYHWEDVQPQDQKTGFIRQIRLAQKYNKPILIHMREATKDTLDILKDMGPLKGIMHCYSGSKEVAMELIKIGFYISFGGPLTFKNSRGAPATAEALPLNRLFVETDSPYLTPHPFRGKQNEPMYVRYTFDKLCEIKAVEKNPAAEQLRKNYEELFLK